MLEMENSGIHHFRSRSKQVSKRILMSKSSTLRAVCCCSVLVRGRGRGRGRRNDSVSQKSPRLGIRPDLKLFPQILLVFPTHMHFSFNPPGFLPFLVEPFLISLKLGSPINVDPPRLNVILWIALADCPTPRQAASRWTPTAEAMKTASSCESSLLRWYVSINYLSIPVAYY